MDRLECLIRMSETNRTLYAAISRLQCLQCLNKDDNVISTQLTELSIAFSRVDDTISNRLFEEKTNG